MLQSPESKYSPNAVPPPNSYTPVKPATAPMDQANIGRSLVIKGDVTGTESLFIDGRVEGTISFPDNRVTIGRNGSVAGEHHRPGSRHHGQGAGQRRMCGPPRRPQRRRALGRRHHPSHQHRRRRDHQGRHRSAQPQKKDKDKDKKTQEPAQSKQESPKAMAATASNA